MESYERLRLCLHCWFMCCSTAVYCLFSLFLYLLPILFRSQHRGNGLLSSETLHACSVHYHLQSCQVSFVTVQSFICYWLFFVCFISDFAVLHCLVLCLYTVRFLATVHGWVPLYICTHPLDRYVLILCLYHLTFALIHWTGVLECSIPLFWVISTSWPQVVMSLAL